MLATVAALVGVSAAPASAAPGLPYFAVYHDGDEIVKLRTPLVHTLFAAYDTAKADLRNSLKAQIQQELQTELAGAATLTSLSVVIDEGLEIGFSGVAGGNIVLHTHLPQIKVYADVHKSGYGDAFVAAYLGPVDFQANYNIFSGLVTAVDIPVVPIGTSVSIDGEWWVDLLDFFTFGAVTDYFEDLINDELHFQLASQVATFLSTKVATFSLYLFGFDNVIPQVQWQGIDVDQLIRDWLMGIFPVGHWVSIVFHDRDIYLLLGSDWVVQFHTRGACEPDPATGVCVRT